MRELFIVRVGADSTLGTKSSFPCPHCYVPIHAFAQGNGPEVFTITFAETWQLALDQVSKPTKIVRANLFLPAKHDADWNSPQVASSMATLMLLLGSETTTFTGELGRRQESAVVEWPRVRRLHACYPNDNQRTNGLLEHAARAIVGHVS